MHNAFLAKNSMEGLKLIVVKWFYFIKYDTNIKQKYAENFVKGFSRHVK